MTVGNIYKHRVYCYFGDQVGINTRYFQVGAIAGPAVSELAFIAVQDIIFAALYKPALTDGAEYIGSDIQNITVGPPYPLQSGTSANQGNGTGGTLPMGAQVSGLISTRTAMSGPAFRGRSYIPFPSADSTDATAPAFPNAAYSAQLQLIANAALGTVGYTIGGGTVSVTWVIYHYQPAALRALPTPITAAFPTGSYATQKRRGNYGRLNPSPVP